MGISVKVEKHEQVPMGRKERKFHRDSVGFIVEHAISALDDRLLLPKNIKVVVRSAPRKRGLLGQTSELCPDKLAIYYGNILAITNGDETALKLVGVGVAAHELSHMATHIRPEHISGSGDELFDLVIGEGKADAVARQILLEQFRAKVSIFSSYEACTPVEKTRILKALAGPRHTATTFWQRLSDAAFRADFNTFMQGSGVDNALNVAGGFICDKFVQNTGDDPFEMQVRSERAFLFSYRQLMEEEGLE